jgi:hypothetical protein
MDRYEITELSSITCFFWVFWGVFHPKVKKPQFPLLFIHFGPCVLNSYSPYKLA